MILKEISVHREPKIQQKRRISRTKFPDRQSWRKHLGLAKRFEEYCAWREKHYPRSYRHNSALIRNYVLYYFVDVQGLPDPNRWKSKDIEFVEWIQTEATSNSGAKISTQTARQAICAANTLLKWFRSKRYIKPENYQPIELLLGKSDNLRRFDDLLQEDDFERVFQKLKERSRLYAEMWLTQGKMGFRISELMGLPFGSVSETCPKFILEEFRKKRRKVYGSLLLESQIAMGYRSRNDAGRVVRAPLKWRPAIGPEYSRTIPITDERVWNILMTRHNEQFEVFERRMYGENPDDYLLFDFAKPYVYRNEIKKAFKDLGLQSTGTHILRHQVSTEWTAFKISEKVSELILGHKLDAHKRYVHIVGQINAERAKARSATRLLKKVEK